MKTIEIIFCIFVSIMMFLLIVGIALNITSSYVCKKECDKVNAYSKIIPSGNFDFKDTCICYEKVEIKKWRMK